MGGIALDSKAFAYQSAEILAQHNALNVLVMDIHEVAGWADYFVLATSTSSTHMRGLQRHIEEFLKAEDVSLLNKPEVSDDQKWLLMDAGNVVIHIMSDEARQFYDLESLWFNAPRFTVTFNGRQGS
jgi:ribosome-associated protein